MIKTLTESYKFDTWTIAKNSKEQYLWENNPITNEFEYFDVCKVEEVFQLEEMINHLESFTGVHISRCDEGFSFSGHDLCDELTEKTNSIEKLDKDNSELIEQVKKYRGHEIEAEIIELKKQNEFLRDFMALVKTLEKQNELLMKCLSELVESIYTSYRLGLTEKPNENWEALNNARECLAKLGER